MGEFMFVWTKRKVKHHRTKNSDEGILMTSTECANMFKEHIIHTREKEFKKMGIGPKLMRKMGYEEGRGIGKYGQGIVKPIEVNTRPKFMGLGYKKYNENKASKKRKTEHFTSNELRLAELDMQIIECEKVVSLRKEKERLVNEAKRKRKKLYDLEVIERALDKLSHDAHSGTLSLELLSDSFGYLKKKFPDEYNLCGLATIACSFALPFFSRLFKKWDPLINPDDHLDVVSVWKDVLQGAEIDSPYSKLFMETVVRAVMRSSVKNSWQATNPEPLLRFFDIWERVMPHEAFENILDRIVMPKFLAAVHEFQVNPADQKLDQFYWVRKWANLVPVRHMVKIMDVFLKKCLAVLYKWLCSKPDLQEVRNWFLGWKNLIPSDFLSNEVIRGRLNMGLVMMNQAVQGLEVVQPGQR